MYVREILIKDFRGIRSLQWKLEPSDASAGWHVLIGDNGAGKSSVLRAVALAMIGPERSPALRLNLNDWIRFGSGQSEIAVTLETQPAWDAGARRKREKVALKISRRSLSIMPTAGKRLPLWDPRSGWFSASYGPFRRFTGGDRESEKLLQDNPTLARHLSMFGENVALTAGLSWLCREQGSYAYSRLKRQSHSHVTRTSQVARFLNKSEIFPNGVHIDEVTSEEVIFRDAYKSRVPAENLSDGHRAVLSMTLELLRQFSLAYPKLKLFDEGKPCVALPGVVMIDEVDAHLHPTWQKSIGPWFVKHFPLVQFIVTTHSPLVCQAAENGTVFQLSVPGRRAAPQFVRGLTRQRLLFGDASEAYGTGVFGVRTTRSETSQQMSKELAQLNTKILTNGLSAKERRRQRELQAAMPTVSLGDAAD